MATSNLEIVINAKDNTGGVLSGIGNKLGGLAKFAGTAVLSGAVAGIAAVGAAFTVAAKEAMDAQLIMAQTDAVIASTGGAAGMSAQAISDLALSLSGVTRYSDDTIQAGENMLLTFTNIGKDVFPLATQTILDMSTAMGQDLQSSAMQLGKALQDPIEGMGALTRVGVKFTKEQEDMIKAMVEAGDVAGAQGVILAELQKEFGGSAKAAGGTLAGQMDILKNSLLNVAEAAGTSLLPILTQGLQAITPIVMQIATGIANFLQSEGFRKFLTDVGTFITTQVIPALKLIWDWLATNLPPVIAALAAFWTNTLNPALQAFANFVRTYIFPVLQAIWDWLATNLPPVIRALADFWTNTLVPAFRNWWEFMKTYVFPVIAELIDWLGAKITPVIQALADFWNTKLKPAFAAVHDFIRDYVIPIIKIIIGWLKIQFTQAVNSAKTAINNIKTAFNNVRNAIQWVIDKIQAFINKLKNIKLPKWLTPGSPTPFEIGLVGIGEQIGNLTNTSIPQLKRSLASIQPPNLGIASFGGMTAGGTPNTTALQSPMAAGYATGGGITVVYSPMFSAASMQEFEQRLVPLIDRQISLNKRRRV